MPIFTTTMVDATVSCHVNNPIFPKRFGALASTTLHDYPQKSGEKRKLSHLQTSDRTMRIAGVLCTLYALFLCPSVVESLAQRRPIRRVAVVGSGVAGLSLAQALTNSPTLRKSYSMDDDDDKSNNNNFEVSIFDARSKLDTTAGAGIQLNGGLNVLGRINPAVQRAVMEAGLPVTGVQSRAKPWNPEKNPFDTLLQLDLRQVVEKAGAQDELIQNGDLLWTSIMRGALQQTLVDTLPADTQKKMQFNKSLTNLIQQDDGSIVCEFADGSQVGPFDLVVGCDGVKSACKEFIERGRISKDASEREGSSVALYSGIRIKYAVKDGDSKQDQDSSAVLSQYFGDGAYCLDGTYGAGKGKPNTKCAFLIALDEDYIGPFKKKEGKSVEEKAGENADWSQDVRRDLADTQNKMLKDVKRTGVPDLDVGPTVSSADRFFELGVYFHNPFSFAGWSKPVAGPDSALMVLCGDAAHTMPPFLGQGSNQAIQDAYCLADKLYQYNNAVAAGNDSVSLSQLIKEYEKVRWPATFNIFWKSLFLGYLETGGTDGIVSKFRDVFFKTMGIVGVAQRVLLSAAIPKV